MGRKGAWSKSNNNLDLRAIIILNLVALGLIVFIRKGRQTDRQTDMAVDAD